MYIKDLKIFKTRHLKDIILVDNSCFSFSNNLSNGVPIIPYYNDKNDKELKLIVPFLKHLVDIDDVRVALKKTFKYKEYKNY
jgi:CTD small phosphatase-like protein 2